MTHSHPPQRYGPRFVRPAQSHCSGLQPRPQPLLRSPLRLTATKTCFTAPTRWLLALKTSLLSRGKSYQTLKGLSVNMNSSNGTRKFSGFQKRTNFSSQASQKWPSNISALFTMDSVFLSDFYIGIKSIYSSTRYLTMHSNLIA